MCIYNEVQWYARLQKCFKTDVPIFRAAVTNGHGTGKQNWLQKQSGESKWAWKNIIIVNICKIFSICWRFNGNSNSSLYQISTYWTVFIFINLYIMHLNIWEKGILTFKWWSCKILVDSQTLIANASIRLKEAGVLYMAQWGFPGTRRSRTLCWGRWWEAQRAQRNPRSWWGQRCPQGRGPGPQHHRPPLEQRRERNARNRPCNPLAWEYLCFTTAWPLVHKWRALVQPRSFLKRMPCIPVDSIEHLAFVQ